MTGAVRQRSRGRALGLALFAAAALPWAASAQVAQVAQVPPLAGEAVPRLLRVEPPRDSARHLGDQVAYRALIAWPPGWVIDRDGVQAPTREDGPLELRGHAVDPAGKACPDCRWLTLTWQLFKAVHITSDVPLPATRLRFRKGTQIATLLLPASRLAVSPLVPWERRADWAGSARPGWQAVPFDVHSRVVESGAWLGAAVLALAAWAWSSGRWLPRRGSRPFAQAWRAVRSRRRVGAGEVPQADADDLRCWHRAFDATAGEVVFAERLDAFFAAQPGLAPLAGQVRTVFEASQRSFYLDPRAAPGTRVALQDLIVLLRRLAEHELQSSVEPGRQPRRRSAHARV